MQAFFERCRLAEQVSDGIEREKLLVAAANFAFGLLTLGDVEDETLIGDGGAGFVARDKGRQVGGANLAVAAAELDFEIAHFAIFVEQSLPAMSLRDVHVKLFRDVGLDQVFALFEAVECA